MAGRRQRREPEKCFRNECLVHDQHGPSCARKSHANKRERGNIALGLCKKRRRARRDRVVSCFKRTAHNSCHSTFFVREEPGRWTLDQRRTHTGVWHTQKEKKTVVPIMQGRTRHGKKGPRVRTEAQEEKQRSREGLDPFRIPPQAV